MKPQLQSNLTKPVHVLCDVGACVAPLDHHPKYFLVPGSNLRDSHSTAFFVVSRPWQRGLESVARSFGVPFSNHCLRLGNREVGLTLFCTHLQARRQLLDKIVAVREELLLYRRGGMVP